MGNKSKKGLLMSLLWALVIITAVVSSVVMTQSAKVATVRFEQTWTYDAPENVQVTFDAGEGYFSNSQHTYDTTIKIDTLSGTSIFPANPTRTGYTFGGYEYSVDGTNYNDYALASDMPFTDHLYARAKWVVAPLATITLSNYSYQDGNYGVIQLYYQIVDDLEDAFGYSGSFPTGYNGNVYDTNPLIIENCIIFNDAVSIPLNNYFVIYLYDPTGSNHTQINFSFNNSYQWNGYNTSSTNLISWGSSGWSSFCTYTYIDSQVDLVGTVTFSTHHGGF